MKIATADDPARTTDSDGPGTPPADAGVIPPHTIDLLIEIAQDLCANLAADDRHRRLAAAVRRLVPCDAATLLRLEDGALVPIVADGLRPETLGLRFLPQEHPRLETLLHADGPVRFTGSSLPDPFDGLFVGGKEALSRVHACMGAPLVVEDEVVGVLTVDALDPRAFDAVDDRSLAAFAGLAGATIRTAGLIDPFLCRRG